MSIRMMCDKSTPGATLDTHWSTPATADKPAREIYTVESHVGLVLSLREMNGYSDSDFYALVWDAEKGDASEVMYASTRGWTYPNGASIDATPEVRAAYEAKCKAEEAKAAARRAEREEQVPRKGRTVKFVKAVKPRDASKDAAAVGEVGEVFWFGDQKNFEVGRNVPRNGYIAAGRRMAATARALGLRDPRDGYRVGVKLKDGRKVFTNAINVEVVKESDNG